MKIMRLTAYKRRANGGDPIEFSTTIYSGCNGGFYFEFEVDCSLWRYGEASDFEECRAEMEEVFYRYIG